MNTPLSLPRFMFVALTVLTYGHVSLPAADAQQPLHRTLPSIHTSPDRGPTALPLPPLPAGQLPATHPENTKWVGTGNQHLPVAAANSVVVPASANQVTSQHSDVRTSTVARTKLNPPSEKHSATGPSGSNSTLKMLLSVGSSLLIVLGLFLGAAWCYRKTLSNALTNLPKSVVSILGRTQLAPRQQLVVLRFGPKLVLVSLIHGEARTISEITDPLEVDQLAGLCESQQPAGFSHSFRNILHQSGGGTI